MSNVFENLKKAGEILQTSGIAESWREANSLLAFALGKDKTFLVAHPEYELSEREERQFQNIVERRSKREPFQYIVGKQEFYGLDFEVTKDVLIPRTETELIVEQAIEILQTIENPYFCEVGVGSGCISVSILHQIKSAKAIGLDISVTALHIAGKNADKHQVSERLKLDVSDVFAILTDQKFDLIVSNPPYISARDLETLQPEVRDYEPVTALSDGGDGFLIVKKIIEQAPCFLKEKGFLLMEIGFDQSSAVEKMFDRSIWKKVVILDDLQGIPRTVKAEKY
jgi:release factor glutamine methyltransferase